MEYNYNLVSLIDILGVIQGLLFGTLLVFLHFHRNKAVLFLGVFIFLFALEPIPNIFEDLGILSVYPKLELFPVNFHFLAYPILFIYIQRISILENERIKYWTLIPGVLDFVLALFVFFLPVDTKLEIKSSLFAEIYFLLGLGYSVYIAVLILKWIRSHADELESQYASTAHKKLNWPKWFIYSSIIFHFLLLLHLFIDNYELYLLLTICNVGLIYWISYMGIVQENVKALVWEGSKSLEREDAKIKPLKIAKKVKSDLMSREEAQETYRVVAHHIVNSKCYMNRKLTIVDVAEATGIHPKKISHAINTINNQNFNNYVNAYRLAYAKELLRNEDMHNLSIEGIGYEAGFHSKTTFYNAFKKAEQMTPAQYKASAHYKAS